MKKVFMEPELKVTTFQFQDMMVEVSGFLPPEEDTDFE